MQLGPDKWRLRVFTGQRTRTGSPVQRGETFVGGRRAAEKRLATMVAEVASGGYAGGQDTFGALLDQFLQHCEVRGLSPTTMKEYRRIATTTLGPLRSVRLSKFTARHLDRLYAEMTTRGNSAATIRRTHALARVALHQGRRWRMVSVNVAEDASPPSEPHDEVRAPTPEEVQRIVRIAEGIDPTLAMLLLMAALVGARRGELVALYRWSDVDWERGTLRIARSIYEVKGGGWAEKGTKTHAVRTIGLDELGLAILQRHRDAVSELAAQLDVEVPADAFIFSKSPAGLEPLRLDGVTAFATKIAEQAGVETHLHAFRHFSATTAVAAGVDPVTVAKRLGHRDPSISLRVYSNAVESRDREMAGVLGQALALPNGGP